MKQRERRRIPSKWSTFDKFNKITYKPRKLTEVLLKEYKVLRFVW